MAVSEADYASHRLGGVIAKFNWSKQQFDVLRSEIGEFFDQDPPPHFSQGYFDTDRWEWIERFQVREKPPLRFGVMLGDCVHNLRSALDHLICQLTMLDGGTMADCARTQYPIASQSEAQFESMAKRCIPGLSEKHRAMVKKTQPYNAGDRAEFHPLYALAELSNADKHRIINPTYSAMKSSAKDVLDRLVGSYQGEGPSPVESWWMLERGSRLEHDAPWFRMVFDRSVLAEPVEVEVSGILRTGMTFGEIRMDADSYRHIGEYVLDTVEAFMPSFPETRYHD
jgi:hypothetical protein